MRAFGERRARKRAKNELLVWLFGVPLLACVVAMAVLEVGGGRVSMHVSKLMFGGENTDRRGLESVEFFRINRESCEDFDTEFAVVLFAITLYTFVGLAIITDNYFEPCLQLISEDLQLSSDVAGATLMASASSAPELLTSFVDAFLVKASVGVGTILGSALFNILIIVAGTALIGKPRHGTGPLKIMKWPIARDSTFYLISIAMLGGVVFNDGELCSLESDRFEIYTNSSTQKTILPEDTNCFVGLIRTVEAFLLILGYVMYVIFMVFNERIKHWFEENVAFRCMSMLGRPFHNEVEARDLTNLTETLDRHESANMTMSRRGSEFTEGGTRKRGFTDIEDDDDPVYPGNPLRDWPDGALAKMYYAISLPYHILFYVTMPGTYMKPSPLNHTLVFILNLVYILALTIGMVYTAVFGGCLLGIDPFLIGVLILAVGTSVPDALASFVVARDGRGDMAIANALGSNVFDIFLGIGLPVFLASLVFNDDVKYEDSQIGATIIVLNGVFVGLVILLVALVLFIGSLVVCRFRLFKSVSILLIAYYVAFVVLTVLAINCKVPVCLELDCSRCGVEPEFLF